MRWQLFGDQGRGAPDSPQEGVELLPEYDAAFWASPVGRAARAMLRGDRFFQIELDDVTLSEYAAHAAPVARGRRARRTCDLLGQIEELGWNLEHVSWWRVEGNAAVDGDRSGRPEGDGHHVRGVYLFHSVPKDDIEGHLTLPATAAGAHTPTHRREVS